MKKELSITSSFNRLILRHIPHFSRCYQPYLDAVIAFKNEVSDNNEKSEQDRGNVSGELAKDLVKYVDYLKNGPSVLLTEGTRILYTPHPTRLKTYESVAEVVVSKFSPSETNVQSQTLQIILDTADNFKVGEWKTYLNELFIKACETGNMTIMKQIYDKVKELEVKNIHGQYIQYALRLTKQKIVTTLDYGSALDSSITSGKTEMIDFIKQRIDTSNCMESRSLIIKFMIKYLNGFPTKSPDSKIYFDMALYLFNKFSHPPLDVSEIVYILTKTCVDQKSDKLGNFLDTIKTHYSKNEWTKVINTISPKLFTELSQSTRWKTLDQILKHLNYDLSDISPGTVNRIIYNVVDMSTSFMSHAKSTNCFETLEYLMKNYKYDNKMLKMYLSNFKNNYGRSDLNTGVISKIIKIMDTNLKLI